MIVTTDISLFQSTMTIKSAVKFGKEKEVKAMILADDNLAGALTFYFSAKESGIKPIFGVRSWIDGVEYLFVAKNKTGFNDLLFFESKGYNHDIFKSENLVPIAINVKVSKPSIKAKLSILRKESSSADKAANSFLKSLSVIDTEILNGKEESDFYSLATMQAIGNATKAQEEIASNAVNARFTYKTCAALENLLDLCVDDYDFGNPVPPKFPFSEEVGKQYGIEKASDSDLFAAVCWEGLAERFQGEEIPQEYKDRLAYEISVISQMKFPGYFLIVWDFVREARNRGIPVGPGRGSAAGSIVAWVLYITNLDPIKYGLLFERFLNPDRVSFPDIDQDFCQDRRKEVIEYVMEKYGEEYVGQVITLGKLGAKGVVRDVARVLNMPLVLGNIMSNKIPETPGIKLQDVYEEAKDSWDEFLEKDFQANLIFQKSLRIQGLSRNNGIHAAALVISNEPLYKNAPIYKIGDVRAIGYEGKYLEEVNLVKYDFLGLKNLTIIQDAVNMIKKNHGKEINLWTLGVEDPDVYQYISTGQTIGMFQIESDGMRDLGKRLQPKNFEELAAMLALYRPGPMQSGMLDSFINRKHGREQVDFFFKEMETELKPILNHTYGMIVYQEQVMQIVQAIAGFSLGEADLVRRAMGKKKPEEMEKISKQFAEGAAKKGFNPSQAKDLFVLIEKFAGYGFNKSHSAAYAVVTYQTAWLKHYYPTEFFAALINKEMNDNRDKFATYIQEARRMGIKISKPDAFTSHETFVPYKGNLIFGTKCIKGVGSGSKGILDSIKGFEKTKEGLIEYMNQIQVNLKTEVSQKEKNLKAIDKKITSIDKKITSKRESLRKLLDKEAGGKILTANESTRKEKYLDELEVMEIEVNTLNANKILAEQEFISIRDEFEEKGGQKFKIKKDVFENMAMLGAFDQFGVSRKSLVANKATLLSGKCPLDIDLSGEDFTIAEKIIFEKELLGVILSSPFEPEMLETLQSLAIDTQIGILIEKTEKTKRDGAKYLVVDILDTEGNVHKASDFNNNAKNISIGDSIRFGINYRGKYANLYMIQEIDLQQFISQQKPKDVEVSVTENVEEISIPDGVSIVVKNQAGVIIARLAR